MILGVIMHEVSMNPNIFVLKATEMKATFGYSISTFRKVVELLGRKKFETAAMISDTISLKDINDKGFQRLLADKSLVKILVKP